MSQIPEVNKLSASTTPYLTEDSSRAASVKSPSLELEKSPIIPDADTLEKHISASQAKQEDVSPRPIHGWKWVLVCCSMYMCAFLYGLDTTIAADVQPDIIKSLGEIEKLAWIGAGFPLGSVAVILPLGYAYGIFEIKWIYLASIVVFEIGSAVCGSAPTMNAEIIGRVIAGAGGAGMYLGLLNYISVFTTLREQSMYNAITGLVWGAGCICGPLIGGGFAISSVGWGWSFYINLVLAAAFAPFLILVLPKHQPKSQDSFSTKIKTLDWLGILLIAATYTTYALAMTFGGSQWPWSSYKFAVMIAFFGVILISFIAQQYFHIFTTKERRLFPVQFLKSRTMLLLYFTTASTITTVFTGAYFIPLFFQFAKGDSAILAAVRLLPFIVLTIVFMLFNGALMPVFGYYQPWFIFSGIMQIIGGSLFYALVDADTSPSQIYGFSVLMGIGAGAAGQAGYAIAAAKTMAKDMTQIPAAIGFINVAQIGTIVISLTISGSVFQNLAYDNLREALSSVSAAAGGGTTNYTEQQIRSALAGTQSAIFQQWNEVERRAAIAAIIKAMDSVFILIIVAGAVTLVSGLAMRREKLFIQAVAGG